MLIRLFEKLNLLNKKCYLQKLTKILLLRFQNSEVIIIIVKYLAFILLSVIVIMASD